MIQIPHCYVAQGVFKGASHFTEDEESEGFRLFWANDLEEAIKLVGELSSNLKDDKYISSRDTEILKSARNKISPIKVAYNCKT